MSTILAIICGLSQGASLRGSGNIPRLLLQKQSAEPVISRGTRRAELPVGARVIEAFAVLNMPKSIEMDALLTLANPRLAEVQEPKIHTSATKFAEPGTPDGSRTEKNRLDAGAKVTLSLSAAPAESIVAIISKQTGINIILLAKSDQRVTLNVTEMPLMDTLTHLGALIGSRVLKVNNAIVIADEATLRAAYPAEFDRNYGPNTRPTATNTTGTGTSPSSSAPASDPAAVKAVIVSKVITLNHYDSTTVVEALKAVAESLDIKLAALPATIIPTLDLQSGSAINNQSAGNLGATNGTPVSKKLLATGTVESIGALQDLINNFDVRPDMVEITVSIYDVNDENVKDAGFTWSPGGFNVSEAVGSGINFGTFTRSGLSFSAAMQALQTENRAKLLASPNVTVLDSNKAFILVGERRQLPIASGTNPNGSFIFSTQEVRVGIYLQVACSVGADGTISLTVKPEVSAITGFLDLNGSKYPQISTRESQSSLSIKEGETIVLGGLIKDEEVKIMQRMPLLSNIPFLGELFKSRRTEHRKSQLLISITPRIIRR